MSETHLFGDDATDSSYRRLFALSEGGMGKVELAVRLEGKFRRLYAVKRLQPAIRADAAAREMFLEEARLAGLIHSPNAVGVLDVGEDEDGPFLAMEYIEGVTVRDIVMQARAEEVPLPVQLCTRVIADAARGLHAAHTTTSHDGKALCLVHRDVSPHNILVGFDGVGRVVDFGIARALGRDHRTSTGVLKGKLGYMAPETLRFEEPSAQSDLFSLGIVLFEMVTGRRLYGGKDDAERARRIVREAPPELGMFREDVPPELEALVIRMLAKEPELRPPSAGDVADRLDAITAQLVVEEGPLRVAEHLAGSFTRERETRQAEIGAELERLDRTPTPTIRRKEARGSRMWIAVVTTMIGIALGGLGVWLLVRPEPETEVVEDEVAEPASVIEREVVAAEPVMFEPSVAMETAMEPDMELDMEPEPTMRVTKRRPTMRTMEVERDMLPDMAPPTWGFER